MSRSFKLYIVDDSNRRTRIQFPVVAADAGYMSRPVPTNNLVIGIAERWEIVVDFAAFAGKNVTMMNERDFQRNPDHPATDRVMRFVVGNTVTSQANNGPIPGTLATLPLPSSRTTVDHVFEFERQGGEWQINQIGFADVRSRILARPKRGLVERWRLVNKSGGWTHPIHIHLVDFQILSREGGREAVTPYEAASLKDTVYLGTNEEVEVLADYAPWPGEAISPFSVP